MKELEKKIKELRELFDNTFKDKAVWCTTLEEAENFLEIADFVGYKWKGIGSLLKRSHYEVYEEDTCYNFTCNRDFGYASKSIFRGLGLEIIQFRPEYFTNITLTHLYLSGEKEAIEHKEEE